MKTHKRYLLFWALIAVFLATPDLIAQETLRLPQSSPHSEISQTIGLTDINISYFRPSVRDRKVFGELVPFGEVWRTGANNATTITFTDDVLLNCEHIPAGTYSLFSIPGKDEWAVILNKDTAIWGTEGYQESGDLMRLTVKPQNSDFTETLTFSFSDISNNKANLNLNWETTQITIPIEVEVDRKVLSEIRAALSKADKDDWQIYAQAANYYVLQNRYHNQALEWINKSLAIKESFYNNWVKARLLAQKEEYKEALNLARKTKKLGEIEGGSFALVKNDVERAITQWKAKQNL